MHDYVCIYLSIGVPCTATECALSAGCGVLVRAYLVISHSNGSWPRKSKRHLQKKILNNSPSTTLSTEPHRTTTNRTGRGAEWACLLGLVGEHCDWKTENWKDVVWMCGMSHSAPLLFDLHGHRIATYVWNPCLAWDFPTMWCHLHGVNSLTDPFFRYRGHQTSQHGGSDGGDNSSRVPPPPLPLVCVQQQQGHPAPLWHESLRTVWQTHQMWECCGV